MNKNITIILIGIVVLGAIVGVMFAIPSFFRYQKRADANNEVQVNEIRIKQQEQLIQEQNLAILATLRKDGTPQPTPINYAYHDGKFLKEALSVAGSPFRNTRLTNL